MGFPVGYSDFFLPRLFFYFLTALGFIWGFVCAMLSLIGLHDFLMPEPLSYQETPTPEPSSVAAGLIRELLLPVVKFSELEGDFVSEPPERCAVCLYEFGNDDEIRRLTNCRHIFHRSCLDRWMDHDQKTCPLCRTPFIPEDKQDAFNERIWVAAGISDLTADYSSVTATPYGLL